MSTSLRAPMPHINSTPARLVWIDCHDCQVKWNEVVEGYICWYCGKDVRPPRFHRERG